MYTFVHCDRRMMHIVFAIECLDNSYDRSKEFNKEPRGLTRQKVVDYTFNYVTLIHYFGGKDGVRKQASKDTNNASRIGYTETKNKY